MSYLYLRFIINISFFGFLWISQVFSIDLPNKNQIQNTLLQIQNNKNISNKKIIIKTPQTTLSDLKNIKLSTVKIKKYKKIINNFPKLINLLKNKKENQLNISNKINLNISSKILNQYLLKLNNKLIKLTNKLQYKQNNINDINNTINQLTQQQTKEQKELNNTEQNLHEIKNKFYNLNQQETQQSIKNNNTLKENSILPQSINNILKTNQKLLIELNQQTQRMNAIVSQKRQTDSQILQIRQTLSTLQEQAQWLDKSPALRETLRNKVSKLPEINKPQQFDNDMTQLKIKRLQYENLINKLLQPFPEIEKNNRSFTAIQRHIFNTQITIQRNLLNSLLNKCDTQILELTKLKIANNQLKNLIKEAQKATHRYLFWVADVNPINFSFLFCTIQDLRRLATLDTFNQLIFAFKVMLTNQKTIIPIFGALLLASFSLSLRKYYIIFLERSSNQVGKVNQDHFSLTLRNVTWSIFIAIPLPILWTALGFGLRQAWSYPMAEAIGEGISNTVLILWVFIICTYFAHPKGLFIVHFQWPKEQVKRAMRYYILSTGMIVPLLMMLTTINYYNDREFVSTLGRLCFILLCTSLALITNSLKHARITLYIKKNNDNNNNNIINYSLWNIMIIAPISAAIGACLGYLATAQALLIKLEESIFICFILLIVYYIIRRWMFIQRRRITFERIKQRRAGILAQRARNNDNSLSHAQINEIIAEKMDKKLLDLNLISAQSLQLVRSILTLIALLSVILLWSELYSAFGFLENIALWDVSSSIQGVNQPITLSAIFISILVFIITTQLVRNLPSLLELAILQHLELTPGTSYAITTMTKYSLMTIGGIIGFSMIGIEWSKLQWLIAALSVGLGFGLQEIFANFISGLMILFEKPIRIGDTVTIRKLTGNITCINTRATIITDWNKKEIIVPNKAFITEQFINWSLTNNITRVVLIIPAPMNANIKHITNILFQAIKRCPLVLKTPTPEVFLVDLQQGLPLFELRMYAAEIAHRMPLRHQVHTFIIDNYKKNGIKLPFPLFKLHKNQVNFYNDTYTLNDLNYTNNN